MKASRVELVREIAKRLRRVAAAMEKEHGRRAGPLELEPFTTDDDAIWPEASVSHRTRIHGAHVPRSPPRAGGDREP
jgi:hypothetical protein